MEKSNLIKNEIKKALYKEKLIASQIAYDTDNFYYRVNCSLGDVNFKVPITDMGETLFKQQEPAQLLIRWTI